MSVLADYSADEQRLLLRSLSAAAEVISAASPGRDRETASEGVAAATYILESRREFLDNSLVSSIQYELERLAASDQPFPNFHDRATAQGARENALVILRDVVALLAARVDAAEAAGYKQWLMNIAVRTAQAGKEGGNFMGWGAVEVNDAERVALRDLAALLGIDAPQGT